MSADTSQSVCRHFGKIPRTRLEASAESPRRIYGSEVSRADAIFFTIVRVRYLLKAQCLFKRVQCLFNELHCLFNEVQCSVATSLNSSDYGMVGTVPICDYDTAI